MSTGPGGDNPTGGRGGADAGPDDSPATDGTNVGRAAGDGPGDAGREFRTEMESGVKPSTAVVESVAAVTGRRPSALPPLTREVDVEGLDEFVGSEAPTSTAVSFTYADVNVVVTAAGTLRLRTR